MVAGNLARKILAPIETEISVPERPVKWCSVSLSDVISRGKRLEASVFDVEAKQALDIIMQGKYGCVPLYGTNGLVEKAHYGSRLKRNYVASEHENSIGFIGSSEMLDIYPQPVKFMVDGKRVQGLHILENTVLLSRSGTIGNVSFYSKTLSRFLVSEHAMRLECKKYAGYIYAFLKTPIGKTLVCSNNYGAVIQQIEPEHLVTVPIPNAPESIKGRIHDLIVRSYELRDKSNEAIDEATRLLVEELHLPPIHEMGKNNPAVNTYSVKLSNMAGRLDASYHVPIVNAIIDHLIRYAAKITTVGNRRISKEVILPPRFARVYVDEGYGRVLIGGKQLHELDPSGKKYLSNTKHKALMNKLEVHQNTTLITRSGTIGKVALVPMHWEHWIPSDHIIRVVPANDTIAGYLYIFLASDYGRTLITRYTYGSVVDEIDDNHVRQIPIPLLSNQELQKKINDLALEANVKRYTAYKLEQEALRVMNEEVIFAK